MATLSRRKRYSIWQADDLLCPECEKSCDAVECDSGIGSGEAWGVPFNDSQPYIGSSCCEAELNSSDAEYYEE